MNNNIAADKKITSRTRYWGFQELSEEQAELVSGGSIEDCVADGDGLSKCIETVTISGSFGSAGIDWANDNFLPVNYYFASAGTSSGGGVPMPNLSPAEQERICDAVAKETVEEVRRARKDGRIKGIFAPLVPSEADIYATAKTVCKNSLVRYVG
jgi:hypothetical protein